MGDVRYLVTDQDGNEVRNGDVISEEDAWEGVVKFDRVIRGPETGEKPIIQVIPGDYSLSTRYHAESYGLTVALV